MTVALGTVGLDMRRLGITAESSLFRATATGRVALSAGGVLASSVEGREDGTATVEGVRDLAPGLARRRRSRRRGAAVARTVGWGGGETVNLVRTTPRERTRWPLELSFLGIPS